MGSSVSPTLTSISNKGISVAPSILAADFTRLGEELRNAEAEGAQVIHVDVMDGHFVPNLSVGPPVVKAVRDVTSLPLDVHLMLTNPEHYIDAFADAGADNITIHVEIEADVATVLDQIYAKGCSAGISLRPSTNVGHIFPFLEQLNLVLIMTVEPGFGGQSFDEGMLPRIKETRRQLDNKNPAVHVEVDGGINAQTSRQAVQAGANLLVAGTSVFRHKNGIGAGIREMRQITETD